MNERKTTQKKRLALRITVCCLAGLLLLAFTGHVFAMFVESAHRRRTVTTWKDTGSSFTSNYMRAVKKEDGENTYTTVVLGGESETLTMKVFVCNYNRTNPDTVAMSDISYFFRAAVCGSDRVPLENTEGKSYTFGNFTVDGTHLGTNTYTSAEKTLTGRSANYHIYEITLPAAFDGYLRLEAIPSSDAQYDNTDRVKLGCFVTTSLERSLPNAWTGKFTGLDGIAPGSDVDGFNYEISGSGAAECILSWDTDYLEVNQWNLQKYGLQDSVTTDGNLASVTLSLPLNVSSGEGDTLFYTYEFQFYRKRPQTAGEDYLSWITFAEKKS